MGFEGKKTLRLTFEDPDLNGLEVVVGKPNLEQVVAVGKERDQIDENASEIEFARPLAKLFCELLVSWNLENDGVEVGHTADALLAQDFDVAQAILSAWENSVFKVAAPLEQNSNDGPLSVAELIPMETLSPSLAS